MSDDRDAMIAALSQLVVPELRSRGFKGTFPHFRRPLPSRIDLLSFQFDRYGGGFVVEIATCPPDGYTTLWGAHASPDRVTTHDVPRRLRLGAASEETNHWFRYDGSSLPSGEARFEVVAAEVLPWLDKQAEPWWRDA